MYGILTIGGNEMTNEQRQTIRKVQSDLIRIQKGEKFFFIIANYEKLGLIYSTNIFGRSATGNKIITGHKWHLTDKAKKYISVIV
jgi:hypothetical protein